MPTMLPCLDRQENPGPGFGSRSAPINHLRFRFSQWFAFIIEIEMDRVVSHFGLTTDYLLVFDHWPESHAL